MEDMVTLEAESGEMRKASAPGIVGGAMQDRGPQFWEVARFVTSGLASTIFYAVVAWLLVTVAALDPVPASILSYLLSLGVSYGLQSRFTFRRSGNSAGPALKFLITAVLGLALSYSLVFLTTEVLHWWFVIGNIAVCTAIPLANYFAFKLWVFVSSEPSAGTIRDE